MVLVDGALGSALIMNSISAFIKDAPQRSLAPSALRGYYKKSVTQKRALTQPTMLAP